MKKSLALPTAVAMLISLPAVASGNPTSRGASSFSPGQQFNEKGSVNDRPGASGYSPGYLKNNQIGTPAPHGASSFAPGGKVSSEKRK